MKYKLRAECLLDILKLFKTCHFPNLKIEMKAPDCTLEFESVSGIEELKFFIKQIPDSHVMIETLAPLAEYTGERKQ